MMAKIVKMPSSAIGAAEIERGSNGNVSTWNADVLRQNVAAALAQESLHAAESVRTYAKCSRAKGDSVQEVLEVLMKLVRDTTPKTTSVSKRSCEVADWAIAAYLGEPENFHLRPTTARFAVSG